MKRINLAKYVGRTCEACRTTSELDKWTVTEKGFKCPACGHVKETSTVKTQAQITIEDAEATQLREDLRAFRASLRGEVTQ
jgi:transcription elongation factor Elf1